MYLFPYHIPGVFSTSPFGSAISCTQITWDDGNTWYQTPFTPGIPPPTVAVFSEGNGNEHRGSFHGYAKGFAQLLHSPTDISNTPMIININKRLTGETSPGPISSLQPRRSLAPLNATYSGILECPCTSRIDKIVDRCAVYLTVSRVIPTMFLNSS